MQGKTWSVPVSSLGPDKWYFLEYSWHPETGLEVYLDNKLVGYDTGSLSSEPATGSVDHVYIGRANPSVETGISQYANADIDEMEMWDGSRQHLLAFDYIQRRK